jgi:hypothetical protein
LVHRDKEIISAPASAAATTASIPWVISVASAVSCVHFTSTSLVVHSADPTNFFASNPSIKEAAIVP